MKRFEGFDNRVYAAVKNMQKELEVIRYLYGYALDMAEGRAKPRDDRDWYDEADYLKDNVEVLESVLTDLEKEYRNGNEV